METLTYKVLLVDDEEEVMDVIEHKIDWEQCGFTVIGRAQNGLKALEIAEKMQPDVVITDIKMPYMDGLELSRRLRKENPGIRIMILTGFDEFEYAKEAIQIEVEEYILKPIDAGNLKQVFGRIHEKIDREMDEKRNVDKLREYYIGYVLLLSYLLVAEFNWKKVIIAMWSMGVIMTVDVISYMLVKLFWIWTGYSDTSLQDIIMSMVTLFILFVVFWLVGRKSKSALSELSWWYYIAFLIICVVNVCVLAILENKLIQRYTEYALVFLLLLIGFIVQMAFVLVLGASNNWHRKNEELKEHYINLQREHYQLLEYKNQEMRKIRHDMRAHLYVMKQYTEQKSWDQLNDYMNTIYGKLDSSHSVRSVHNETVDAVLNYYGEKFRNNGCTFRLRGRMPEVCYIDAYDLCIIFSNILSNAFEAVEKVETKWVKLYGCKNNGANIDK